MQLRRRSIVSPRRLVGAMHLARQVALGAMLFLAGCALFSSGPGEAPAEYVVRPGDTVGAIAARFRVDESAVLQLNGITDPRTLQIGTVLKIPLTADSDAPIPTALARERAPRGVLSRAAVSSARQVLGEFVWPVTNARLTSTFGYRWLHFHEGIDLAAPEGTPIRAAHAGVVVYNGSGIKGYGQTIAIKKGDVLTVYAHNSENSVDVGDEVAAGDEIGKVGSSGRASGPHCHFETRLRNSRGKYAAVDPLAFFDAR